jgi:tetratricopeptide (TPR) repeat protein
LLFAVLAFAVAVCAFGANQGTISGSVRDGDGKPLSGVSITLFGPQNHQAAYRVRSGSSGDYRFTQLPDGEYSLSAELSGYATTTPLKVRIQSGIASVVADLTLIRTFSATEPGAFASDAPAASHPKLEFQTAGIRGLIDPGGYSASSSSAASGLLRGIADIKRTDRNFGTSAAKALPCAVEPQLQKAAADHPNQLESNLRLGAFYVAHDQPAKAIPFLKRSLSIDGSDYNAMRELAIALLQSGDFENALKLLTQVVATHPTSEAHQLLARADEGSGLFRQAAQEYKTAGSIEPSEESFFGEGYELVLAGSPADGAIAFEGGVKSYPQSIPLRIGAGTTQFLLGNAAEALDDFLDATDIDPADPRPYPFVASASELSRENIERVRNSFKRYLDRKPDSGAANYFYALALSRESDVDTDRVETLLKRAIELDPNLAKAHLQLADLYAHRDDYEAAVPEYEAAVRLAEDLSEAHYRLAMAYKHTGHTEQSAREMEIFRLSKQHQASGNAAQGIDVAQFISVMDTADRHANEDIQCSSIQH